MKTIATSRLLLWLVLAGPGIWILYCWNAAPQVYGYGHVIGDTGRWAAWLLIATLAATPVHRLFRRYSWSVWPIRHRRDLGVASFAYATGHTIIYLGEKVNIGAVLADFKSLDIIVGWLALTLLLPLAVTSNDVATRALKRSWKRLHRLVYPAAVLSFLHWVLAAYDPTTAYIHIAVLTGIGLVRLSLDYRQRVT